MPETQQFQVDEPTRLDLFLINLWPELRRRAMREMILEGHISVNGVPARKLGQYLQPGDRLEAQVPDMDERAPEPEGLLALVEAEIAYEDDTVLVMDKPSGMALYPGPKQPLAGTLVAQLQAQYPDLAHVGGVDRAGIVQRLEVEASGLVLVGRTEDAYRALKREVKRERVERRYLVLVEGNLVDEDVIDMPIGNVKRARGRLMVAREGRPARTAYQPLRHYKELAQSYTLLEVVPESSRMHQIRVHLSWYGCPVVGDTLYGSPARSQILTDRLFLHLSSLTFSHPITGALVSVESPLPLDLNSLLRFLVRPRR